MKKLLSIITFLILFSGVVFFQFSYDQKKVKSALNEPIILNSKVIKSTNLGLHNVVADLVWLAAIQYFGGKESETYQALSQYLFLTSELDPKFAYPYAFGALILPSIDQVDEGIALAKKGIIEGVPDWRVPYYLATTYYLVKDNPTEAAKYFDLSANTLGAPNDIRQIAANFGSHSDKRDKTKLIWRGIYENSKDEMMQERAKKYIVHLEILDLLDQAIVEYNRKYNKIPQTLDDLVAGKILKAIPADPLGFELIIFNGKAVIK